MSDLISREAIDLGKCRGGLVGNRMFVDLEDVAVAIKAIPSVDAVEVVRCGECEYINKFPCPARDCNTGDTKNCIAYCSMGKRRESEAKG